MIDFGPRTVTPGAIERFDAGSAGGYPVSGPAAGVLQNGAGAANIDSLGKLIEQADGSLVVVPAPGVSGSIGGVAIGHFANNPAWFDNTSDGPVRCTLVFSDNTSRQVENPSWVVITPPDFAPAVSNIVTLYDVLLDIGVRRFGIRPDIYPGAAASGVDDFSSGMPPFSAAYKPSYRDDVYPILSRPALYAWVQTRVVGHHHWDFDALSRFPFTRPSPSHPTPAEIFNFLRQPEDWNAGDPSLMPRLFGDEDAPTYLTLTPTQYHILRQWSAGSFDRTGWAWPVSPVVAGPAASPQELDRAALEACSGGAFFPGIELGWIVREPQLYVMPFEFRFRHPPAGAGGPLGFDSGAVATALYPGDATKRMACPWQADFWKCRSQWWPAQRPDEVVTHSAPLTREAWARNVTSGVSPTDFHGGMAVNWHRLGIVVPAGPMQVETERDPSL